MSEKRGVDFLKLLLHMCCGPCSVSPLEALRGEVDNVEGFFYNPNIHPIEEYLKRKENVEEFADINNLKVNYIDEFKQDVWEESKLDEPERCNMCYSIRLDKTAAYAKENGFDAFTTSLLVSPYQKHDKIIELGEYFANKYDIKFYYKDFRPLFRKGQQIAKEIGLYRQRFCGCIISYKALL